jgi:uncharacterized protein (TIGR02594 family)
MTTQPWIAEAWKLNGLRETPGPAHTPEIVQMWKDIKRGGIKDDETPWCAAFVGAMLERVSIRSSRFESAKSYLEWGQVIPEPCEGCVVVFTREGGGHVGFVIGKDARGNLLVLGGNQSNAVNVRAFPLSRVTGYRYPSNLIAPAGPLPVLPAAQLSEREA